MSCKQDMLFALRVTELLQCDDLNESGLHGLICLNTRSLVSGTVW